MGSSMLGYKTGRDPEHPEPKEARAREIYGRPDFTVFTGLEELKLLRLYEELPWWRTQLVQILRKNAPSLRRLALSLSKDRMWQNGEAWNQETHKSFCNQLCDEYGTTETSATTTGATAPLLHIQSLGLGKGLYPYRLRSLEKLVDLRHVRDVYVDNADMPDHVASQVHGDDGGNPLFAFGPAHCPHLRRFAASTYHGGVHNFLAAAAAEDSSWPRQLAIWCPARNGSFTPAALLCADPLCADPARYPALPLHLRMLAVELHGNWFYQRSDERGFRYHSAYHGERYSAEQALADLVADDHGALEGLGLRMVETPQVDGEFHHQDLVARALAQLIGLRQLSIQDQRFAYSPYTHDGPRKDKYWHKNLARTACKLAVAVPHLRYIRIYSYCWRICRDGSEDGAVRLEELEDEEIRDVELFNIHFFSLCVCAKTQF